MIITKDDKIEFKNALRVFERLSIEMVSSEYGYSDNVKNGKLNYAFSFDKEVEQ